MIVVSPKSNSVDCEHGKSVHTIEIFVGGWVRAPGFGESDGVQVAEVLILTGLGSDAANGDELCEG
jgi:hypothetical protein